jgi:hypothetical protein
MSTGSIAIRAIAHAGQLLPRKTEPSVASLVEIEGVDQKVKPETKRPKSVGYYSPEWWESHHYERR